MKRILPLLMVVGWGVACAGQAGAGELPHVQEVLRLIRANLPGVTEADMNRAMVEGLLDHFHPRVMLVTNTGLAQVETNLVRRAAWHEGGVVHLGLWRLDAGAAGAVGSALATLEGQGQERVRGMVLDLRWAGGDDYGAAAELADRFVAEADRPLLRWEGKAWRSTSKTNAWSWPTVVLVNGATVGAAEALAAALREGGWVLLLGERTAGRAQADRVFPLGDGLELRIATAEVVAGEARGLAGGVEPDLVSAPVVAEEARVWAEDPYRVLAGQVAVTNRARVRMNEAELVRRREGGLGGALRGASATPAESAGPVVQDPWLARALDLLRGLAVMGRPLGR